MNEFGAFSGGGTGFGALSSQEACGGEELRPWCLYHDELLDLILPSELLRSLRGKADSCRLLSLEFPADSGRGLRELSL